MRIARLMLERRITGDAFVRFKNGVNERRVDALHPNAPDYTIACRRRLLMGRGGRILGGRDFMGRIHGRSLLAAAVVCALGTTGCASLFSGRSGSSSGRDAEA